MKIFFCETFDDGTVGGSHACMYNLLRHLDRSKIQCTAGFLGENLYTDQYRREGIPVKILPIRNPVRGGNVMLRKALNWYRLEYRARKYLEAYFKQEAFDLIVLNNSIFVGSLFLHACRKLRIPTVVYERGFAPYQKKHIRASSLIDCSVPVSDAVHHHMLARGFRARRVVRIYDGIEPDGYRSRKERESVKKVLGIPPQSPVIGIVGNLRPWKGQEHFVGAFLQLIKEYRNLYGLIAGGWAEADRPFVEKLKRTVLDAGYEDRVLFLGYRTDVIDLLSILDVFVHASVRPEPFGMVILEAMAAERPIVATNVGGPVEILNSGECGILVPPGDGSAIAEACREYLENPSLARQKVRKATQRLNDCFHISRTRENIEQLFEHIVSRNKPQQRHHHRPEMISTTGRGIEI